MSAFQSQSDAFFPENEPEAADTQILIVDDDPQLGDLLVMLLQNAGYRTEVVRSGRAALDYLARRPVELLITDIFMPDFDGLELLFALRKVEPRPRLIAMSGNEDTEQTGTLHMAAQLGAERRLCKPFKTEQLLQYIREILGGPAANRFSAQSEVG